MSVDTEPTMPSHTWDARPSTGPTPVDPWGPPITTMGQPRPTNPQTPEARYSWAPPPMAFQPGFGRAPGWPYPPATPNTAPHRASARIAAAVVGAALAVIALIVLITTVGGSTKPGAALTHTTPTVSAQPPSTTTTPPPPPPISPAALAGLLLDTDTINALINSGELAVDPKHTTTKLFTDTADHPACGGVLVNASKQVYDGSGWVAAQTQALRDNTTRQHVVYESVISYPSARTATKMVAQEAHNWQRCNGRSITTTATSYPAQTWFVATVDNHDGMLTALMNQEGARGWACQHALTARNNIVIDIEVCGADITHQATAIAKKVAQNVH